MDPQTHAELTRAVSALPLFPLPGVVFLPSTLLPLHVFEPRYRKLVADCLRGNGIFGVPLLREGWQSDYEGRPPVHEVTGVGRIVRHQDLPDGRYNLLVLGLGRARILDEPATDEPYRLAHAALLEDYTAPGAEERVRLAAEQLRLVSGQVMRAQPTLAPEVGRALENARGPGQLVDMLAHLVLREPADRQTYLEADDLLVRADLVTAGLLSLFTPESSIEA